MAYQALYRKYRPASFDEVVGQEHIVRTLKNAIQKNRIAHAYLFCGPRGTGKTSIAKIFARTLNCTGENPPCMKCENCRLSLAGSHPDIIEIDAASNNGVDEVRALIDRVGYAPLEGKYKVYIIDEVHMMTTGAFNALLKTIEEPPAHVIFIFATTEPHKVLPTILSRCQRYDFSKVSHSNIEKRLIKICEAESIQADEDALALVAELADGGMRDALSILDQCIAYEQDHLTLESVREIYGVVQPEEIGSLVEKLNPETAEEAIRDLEEIENKGMDMKRLTADLISLYKDSLLMEMAKNTNLISEKKRKVIEKSFLPQPINKRIDTLNDLMNLYNKLAYSSNVMDYLETILLKSALWKSQIPVSNGSTVQYEKQIPQQIPSENISESQQKSRSKPVQTPKVREKTDLASLFWKSDVSRETIQPEKKSVSEFIFPEDFLLGLLVGATKAEKSQDQSHMNAITQDLNDLEFGKFANALMNSAIAASSQNYLLLAAGSKLSRDQINTLQDTLGFEGYMKKLLGRPKKVFALTRHETNLLIQKFKERAQTKTLPPAAQIEIAAETLPIEESIEDQLKKRFDDLQIVND